MGRTPCCDKIGTKKGPWTPEEDIMLVSYIQEHGPGNWRSVPANTGLNRCSKSCRLRWTNYLKPGIKRGNFTEKEEKLILHLQALLGNRWAAIASYLPQRTDNDVKNYWNTHLKKKLLKINYVDHDQIRQKKSNNGTFLISQPANSKGQWERRLQTDIHTARKALCEALSLENKPDINYLSDHINTGSSSTTSSKHEERALPTDYVWSMDNVSRLLQGWINGNSPKSSTARTSGGGGKSSTNRHEAGSDHSSSTSEGTTHDHQSCAAANDDIMSPDQALELLLSVDSSSVNIPDHDDDEIIRQKCTTVDHLGLIFQADHQNIMMKQNLESTTDFPISMLEKWLLDEAHVAQDSCDQMVGISLGDTNVSF